MPVWLAVLFSVSSAVAMWLGFYFAYLRPGRIAERAAAAREREALALITSDAMHSAFRVLIGEQGDPAQGIPEVPGVGKRLARLESELKPNGGGSVRDVLDQIHRVAVDNAEANRQTAAVAGEAAALASTADQRVQELGVGLRRVEDKLDRSLAIRDVYLELLRERYDIDLSPEDLEGDG